MRWPRRNDLWISGHDMEITAGATPNINGVSSITPGLAAFLTSTPRFSGSKSLVLQNNANGAARWLELGSVLALNKMVAGASYRLTAMVYNPSPQGGYVLVPADTRLAAFDGVGWRITNATKLNMWERLVVNFTINPAAAGCAVRMYNQHGNFFASGKYVVWDSLRMEMQEHAVPMDVSSGRKAEAIAAEAREVHARGV